MWVGTINEVQQIAEKMGMSTDEKNMNLSSLVPKSLTVAMVGLSLSCKEPLPAYRDPAQVFSGSARPAYLFSKTQNHLGVQLVVVNDYDETFEGRSLFEGSIEIALSRKPDLKKTFFLSSSNLIQGKYNPGSRILSFDPRDSIRVGVTWDFIDDREVDLRTQEFVYRSDPMCSLRRISQEETFIIKGNLKLYDRTDEIKFGPVTMTLCHVNVWVDKVCVTLTPDEACRLPR